MFHKKFKHSYNSKRRYGRNRHKRHTTKRIQKYGVSRGGIRL
nr:MAG: hypothetical protein [Microviridae sp.]